MNDRELLELAAKAAGIEIEDGVPFVRGIAENGQPTCDDWNPLTDDGDALRLAVCLGLTVSFNAKGGPRKTAVWTFGVPMHNEYHGSDSFAATRRAIVRAAAEIGRAMV